MRFKNGRFNFLNVEVMGLRKAIRVIASVLSVAVLGVMGLTSFYSYSIPEYYRVFSNESFSPNLFLVDAKVHGGEVAASTNAGSETDVDLSLFGIIPIKRAHVSRLDEQSIIPCGTPFGVKILSDGVLVIGLSSVATDGGEKNPAGDAGLKVGDLVISIDNKKMTTNAQVAQTVADSKGKELTVKYRRKEEEKTTVLKPVKAESSQEYKAGMWVRDSSAGIGTVTFCTGDGIFGGLGHPICDVDTGDIMPLGSGEIVGASINGVKKGDSGSPGELCGDFLNNETLGNVQTNCDIGLYGKLNKPITVHDPVPVGLKQDIKLGDASIYSTIDGQQPQQFSIKIESVDFNSNNRNLVIRVTDKRLLEQTGGVVQGMSGSPIIQNGKLVGAVTHVLVNDPSKGYGIFAETMLAKANELKN